MSVEVTPTGQACGARVTGLDLSARLDDAQVAELRRAWLEHHVLVFPEQEMTDDEHNYEVIGPPVGATVPYLPDEAEEKQVAGKKYIDFRNELGEVAVPLVEHIETRLDCRIRMCPIASRRGPSARG